MIRNPQIDAFFVKLADANVQHRCNWQAKRDPNLKGYDIEHLSFIGDGFRPSEATAVIISYGRDGYGLYFEAVSNSIDGDVARIAAPRAPHPVAGPAELAAKLQEAVDAWPQFDGEDEVNGGDMVEWFGTFRSEARALLGWLPTVADPDAETR
ncbi:MAG: hypothetical protein E5W82_10540 [Mesorhizobium sp.]|nr:MAG: hypothetical protein E5W82_10540 [Mesorhizobium sp.]